MKARTARVYYLAMFIISFVGVAILSAIIGAGMVFPFAYTTARDFIQKKIAESGPKSRTAKAVAKAKKDALVKEKAQLNKDKKALEKKKKKERDKQVKRIYEERMAEGYEASLDMIKSTPAPSVTIEPEKPAKPKKEKKAKKEKKQEVEVLPVVETPIINLPQNDQPVDGYTANGSMFRGISF
ncbi:MAG: hypothetical protein PUD72_03170 [Oscillospiraceae bacterium]|nr:hypothetical protein [Oscillospiraceae bacterium]